MSYQFVELKDLPDYFFEAKASALHEFMGNLSITFIDGSPHKSPIFLSVLLHGNEHTGWRVIQGILHQYRKKKQRLDRPVILLIGNVIAAEKDKRTLDEHPDLNRIWQDQEGKFLFKMKEVEEILRTLKPAFFIDIHNTSGRNITYSCVPSLNAMHLRLARLFGRVVVFIRKPDTTLMHLCGRHCPAVILECGQSLEPVGISRAEEFVKYCLQTDSLSQKAIDPNDMTLLETVATIHIKKGVSFCFEGDENEHRCDLVLRSDLDLLNFLNVPQGEFFGTARHGDCLEIRPSVQEDIGFSPFNFDNGQIRVERPSFFAMLSLDKDVIQKDCLGYVMKEIPLP